MADVIIIAGLAMIAFIIIRGQLRRLGRGSCCAGGCAGCGGSCLRPQSAGPEDPACNKKN